MQTEQISSSAESRSSGLYFQNNIIWGSLSRSRMRSVSRYQERRIIRAYKRERKVKRWKKMTRFHNIQKDMKILLDKKIEQLSQILNQREQMKYQQIDTDSMVKEVVKGALKLQHDNYMTHIVKNLDKLIEGLAVLDHGIVPYFRQLFFFFSFHQGEQESPFKSRVKPSDDFEFKNFSEYMQRFLRTGADNKSVRERFLKQKAKLEAHLINFKDASQNFLDAIASLKTSATQMNQELLGQNMKEPWKYHDFEQWALFLKSKHRLDKFTEFQVSTVMRQNREERKEEEEYYEEEEQVERNSGQEEEFCSVGQINRLKEQFDKYLNRKKALMML